MAKWTKIIKKTWPWIGGLFTTVIAGLLVEYTKEYPIPGAIRNSICYICEKFITLMNINLKLWWILIFITIMLILRYIINNIEITKAEADIKKEELQLPSFLAYKREIVDKIPWEWNWSETYNGWTISDLHPCCPKDGARLNQYDSGCPICKTNYWGTVDYDKVAAIIENKLKKEFPNNQ